MITIDECIMPAPLGACFRVAAQVERWPEFLRHYRRVRWRRRDGVGTGLVEMAAWRPFAGPLRYPTWWVSEMRLDPAAPAVLYTHVQGITRGMEVVWAFSPRDDGQTQVRVTHEWDGPAWPLIGRFAADAVIGPHFISAIASRTLAGVSREAARQSRGAHHEA